MNQRLKRSLPQPRKVDVVPIQIGIYVGKFLQSTFFTQRAVVTDSLQCFRIGIRIHFLQLREDCVSALTAVKYRYAHICGGRDMADAGT